MSNQLSKASDVLGRLKSQLGAERIGSDELPTPIDHQELLLLVEVTAVMLDELVKLKVRVGRLGGEM